MDAMMRWCRICGLVLLFLLLSSYSVHAYERDVHYDLTKYLARWAGFSEDEAEQIAMADQEIDAKPEFNPLPDLKNICPELRQIAGLASAIVAIPVACKNDPEFQRMLTAQRAYHFVDSERLRALRESAFQGRNLKTLGHYLHALQDTFAHSLMDYADLPPLDKLVASLGRLPDEKVIGHFLYGHSLDKTYERPDLAEQMARYVYAELTCFKESANRWNEVETAIARFVREKDGQRQLRYIATAPPEEPTRATPHEGKLRKDNAGAERPQVKEESGQRKVQTKDELKSVRPERASDIPESLPTMTRTNVQAFLARRLEWVADVCLGVFRVRHREVLSVRNPQVFADLLKKTAFYSHDKEKACSVVLEVTGIRQMSTSEAQVEYRLRYAYDLRVYEKWLKKLQAFKTRLEGLPRKAIKTIKERYPLGHVWDNVSWDIVATDWSSGETYLLHEEYRNLRNYGGPLEDRDVPPLRELDLYKAIETWEKYLNSRLSGREEILDGGHLVRFGRFDDGWRLLPLRFDEM